MLWPSSVSSSCWGSQGRSREDQREKKWAGVSQERWRRPCALSESQVSGWVQSTSHLDIPPHLHTILQAIFLDMMYTSYQFLAGSAHTYASYTHSSKIPLDPSIYMHLRSHPSLHLYSTHIYTHHPVYPPSPFYIYYLYISWEVEREEEAVWSLRKAFVSKYSKQWFFCFPKWHKDVEF